MKKIKVSLRPIITKLNLPTVLKTAILPGEFIERLFIATQVGEIFYIGSGFIRTFLDLRSQIIKLGTSGGKYDERGLLGLAFHPEFQYNGLFYLHYSVAGTQGPGALSSSFQPDPCNPSTQILQWENRETQYDHIDTVEEWVLSSSNGPTKNRTLLNLRRPFFNHNGVNSLNFSPETGKLVLTTGDGGSGFDPFNLAQNDQEIAGKIIEIDIDMTSQIQTPPVVTRFEELPRSHQEWLTVIAKGVRNIPGIVYQKHNNQYIKYVGNVGQNFEEAIYSFVNYKPFSVAELIRASENGPDKEGIINLGWRGWEGSFPTPITRSCTDSQELNEKIIAYYNEAVKTLNWRIPPLTSYFHQENRSDKFSGTALTGISPYMGNAIPALTNKIVFTDFARRNQSQGPTRGVLAYTKARNGCKHHDYGIIETDYDFGNQSAFFTCLGANHDQTKLYLGVYSSSNVTTLNQGMVLEIVMST